MYDARDSMTQLGSWGIGVMGRLTMKWSIEMVIAVIIMIALLVPVPSGAQQKWAAHDDLFSLSFPTDKDGWACGRSGAIVHSSDGGMSWTRQVSGTTYTLTSIYFVDARTGWAVGNNGTILHTSDGGATWEKQASPVEYYHMGVHFVSRDKGFVVSERTNILATDDGGKTWAVVFKDEDFILKSISFCDERHGWVVGEFGYTYRTEDGGEHWEKQGGHYDLDPDTGNLKGGDFFFDVIAVDPQTAWRVGIQGIIEKTVDGGKTWQRVEAGIPQVPLYCISCDRASTLIVGGKGVCVNSADKGVTWQNARFEPTVEYSWIYHIARVGDSGFAACGDEGAIYRKTSGSIWQRVAY